MDGTGKEASTSPGVRGMAGRPATPSAPPATSIPMPGGRTLVARLWPGEGIPVVLLHGLLDSSEGWNDLARGMSRPCIAFDLPGFGGSDLVMRPRIASYASDVLAGLFA